MELTQEYVRSRLDYDPESGVFKWKTIGDFKANAGTVRVGDVAGHVDYRGYVLIGIRRRRVLAHRVAWLWWHGFLPEKPIVIDHINRIKSDNRICNLRLADRSQNVQNVGLRSNNTSGHRGVSYSAERGKWVAMIHHKKTAKPLGRFDTKEEAINAYRSAARRLFGEYACFDAT